MLCYAIFNIPYKFILIIYSSQKLLFLLQKDINENRLISLETSVIAQYQNEGEIFIELLTCRCNVICYLAHHEKTIRTSFDTTCQDIASEMRNSVTMHGERF
jgi:hypothetical protein